MYSLDLDGGNLKLPLSNLTSFSYNKTANIIQVTQLRLRTRGYGCQALNFSMSLNANCMDGFRDLNPWMHDYSFSDLIKFFIEYKTSKDRQPYNVILAGKVICPELLFVPTQINTTFQSDNLGNIQQLDINFVLSGCRCTKQSSRDLNLTSSEVSILKTSIVVDGKKLDCKDDVAISEFTLMPTSLHLQLLLSDSFTQKYPNDWLKPSDPEKESFIEVEGFGKFYVITSSIDESIATYECSIFDKQAEDSVSITWMDASDLSLLGSLNLTAVDKLNNIKIDHYRMDGSSIDLLREMSDNLGFLVGFDNNAAYCFEVPTEVPADVLVDNSNVLNFFLDADIKSAPTCRVVYRDAEHQFKVGDKNGRSIIINSPICTPTDRSDALLRYYALRESAINMTVPFDGRIRHYSWVKVNLGPNGILPCMVSDYFIDVLENTMTLTLNYIQKRS